MRYLYPVAIYTVSKSFASLYQLINRYICVLCSLNLW